MDCRGAEWKQGVPEIERPGMKAGGKGKRKKWNGKGHILEAQWLGLPDSCVVEVE